MFVHTQQNIAMTIIS